MQRVTVKPIVLSVIMMSAITLNVVMINVMLLQKLTTNLSEENRNGKIWLSFTLKASSTEFRSWYNVIRCFKYIIYKCIDFNACPWQAFPG